LTLPAFIRLAFATALLVLLSGTVVLAHEGHHRGGQRAQESVSGAAAVPTSSAVISDLSGQDPFSRNAALHRDGPGDVAAVSASEGDLQPVSSCDAGCCCCDSVLLCGMASCTAVALSTADEFLPLALRPGKFALGISDVRAGRDASGLDRPPKS